MAKKAAKPTIDVLLQDHLTNTGLSQAAFAKEHGLSKSTVQFIASGGGTTLSLENARILSPILGRSVAELVGLDEKEAGGGGGDGDPAIRLIPHRLIVRSAVNPRKAFDEAGIAELADSIVQDGVLQNMIVRSDGAFGNKGVTTQVKTGEQMFELVGGERRHRAIALAIQDGRLPKDFAVPCRIMEGSEAQIRAIALLENLQRQDLAPLEEADAFQVLVETCGWTTAQIAERIHKTQRFVQQRMALVTKLTREVRTALSDGTLKLDQARALTAAEPKQQMKMLKDIQVSDYGLKTGDDIRRRITKGKVPASYAVFPLDKYLGDTITDDDGNVYFSDRKEFDKLQKAAVEELRLDKSAEGWAFVIVDHLYLGDYVEERSINRKQSGVVIDLDWQGQVEVHEGVVPEMSIKAFLKHRAELDAEEEEESSETHDEYRARIAKEREERLAVEQTRLDYLEQINPRIREAMDGSPVLMLHFALWRTQADSRHRGDAPDLLTWEQITALSLESAAIRIAHINLFTSYGEGEPIGLFTTREEQNDGVRAVFAAISEPVPAWMEEERDANSNWIKGDEDDDQEDGAEDANGDDEEDLGDTGDGDEADPTEQAA